MGQSTLDLLWDSTLINPVSPLFFARVHAEIISDKPIGQAPNPIQMPEVSPPQTISGGITHGVSQFIVGFIPAVRATKFIKPLKNVGSWVKGMIAGSVTDFTVFSPHEERLSNLVQEFPELANPITEYLQAKPDDSFAEGRLKNSLEGLLVGGLAEPLTRSLRLLKYSRIKITGTEVRTKVHHKIETVEVELDEVNWNNVVKETGENQISKETQAAAEKIGIDLKNININNGTAKVEIKITSEINYSDVKLLVAHAKSKGAQKVEVNTGYIANEKLMDFLEKRVADGKPFMGGKVVRGNSSTTDFTIIYD
ncbi:hypothetical protein [Gilliamella sp. wkB308]|uniref:hypothetical protein n=1 Tax=Gilliamella sp. wkB308 TaxID=3120263 RepID=UPI00117A6901|nr:hypothetical protein [Gilliamella apicola]